jgi:hypothetical protein
MSASDVAGDLQWIEKNKIKQRKTPKRMPHFFIASSPFLGHNITKFSKEQLAFQDFVASLVILLTK